MNPIVKRTAEIFGLSPEEITGPSRARHIVIARQAAVWALRQRHPDMSCCALSAAVGRKDHTTALWAIAAAERRAAARPDYAAKLDQIHHQVDKAPPASSGQLDRSDPGVDGFLRECGL